MCPTSAEYQHHHYYPFRSTNVFGGLNVARAFLPYMRSRRTGTVMWIGSVAGWTPVPNIGIYVSTKYALRGDFKDLSTLGFIMLIM